jgi:hypothetical protein
MGRFRLKSFAVTTHPYHKTAAISNPWKKTKKDLYKAAPFRYPWKRFTKSIAVLFIFLDTLSAKDKHRVPSRCCRSDPPLILGKHPMPGGSASSRPASFLSAKAVALTGVNR